MKRYSRYLPVALLFLMLLLVLNTEEPYISPPTQDGPQNNGSKTPTGYAQVKVTVSIIGDPVPFTIDGKAGIETADPTEPYQTGVTYTLTSGVSHEVVLPDTWIVDSTAYYFSYWADNPSITVSSRIILLDNDETLNLHGVYSTEPSPPDSFVSWSFVQFTDTQLGDANYQTGLKNIENAIRLVNEKASEFNVKFVLVTGDIIDDLDKEYGSPQYFPQMISLLDTLTVDYYTVIGNHDGTRGTTYEENSVEYPELYLQYFGAHQTDPSNIYYYLDYENLRLIVVGQEIGYPGGPKDYLKVEELNFLDSMLDTTQVPVVAFHEPLDWPSNEGYEIGDPGSIINLLNGHANMKLFICGHVHPYDPSLMGLGNFYQYVMPATGNRWGRGYGGVTFFTVSETYIEISYWDASDSGYNYSPTETLVGVIQTA